MNRKGIFFTLDAVIGITILFVGSFVAYFAFIQEPVLQPSVAYAEDIMGILATTRFSAMNLSLTDPYLQGLVRAGLIDVDKTVLAQLGEFYYVQQNTQDSVMKASIGQYMANTLTAIVGRTIPPVYGWAVRIDGKTVYTAQQGPMKDNAEVSVVTQHMTFGTYKRWAPYGPYLVEVEVWA
ncbi:hypothetical protein HY639_03905 [Candidatus Woesearchaeota archaeon]|nr:hypothetical protein [Candidatus Woesearchaeota archaeon]